MRKFEKNSMIYDKYIFILLFKLFYYNCFNLIKINNYQQLILIRLTMQEEQV